MIIWTNTIIVAHIHVLNLVLFLLIFVSVFLPIRSSDNHFGSSLLSLGYYDLPLPLFSLHLDSYTVSSPPPTLSAGGPKNFQFW